MSFFRRIIGALAGDPGQPRTTILSDTIIDERDLRDGYDPRDPRDDGSDSRRRGRRGGRGRGRGEGAAPEATSQASTDQRVGSRGPDLREPGPNWPPRPGQSRDAGSNSDRGSSAPRTRWVRPRRDDLDAPLPEDVAFRPASEGGDATILPGRRRRPPGTRIPGRVVYSDLTQYVARDGAGTVAPPLQRDALDETDIERDGPWVGPDGESRESADGEGEGGEIRRRRRGRRGGRGRRRPGEGGEASVSEDGRPTYDTSDSRDESERPSAIGGAYRDDRDESDDVDPEAIEDNAEDLDDFVYDEDDEAFSEEEGDEFDEAIGLASEEMRRAPAPEIEVPRFSRRPAASREAPREQRQPEREPERDQQREQPRPQAAPRAARDARAYLEPVDPATFPEAFVALGIGRPALEVVTRAGFTAPSPIQAQTIPLLLEGRDIVGVAQTGTGKTMAFGIPMVERLDPSNRAVQALVLVPTRELAQQVLDVVQELAAAYGMDAVGLLGGHAMDRDFRALERRPHIVVGTPGRIIDHLQRGTLSLSDVHYAVLDEADQMLDIGFLPDITRILSRTPRARQTALFSATMPHTIVRLVRRYMTEPEMVAIALELTTVDTVEQIYYEVAQRDKLWGLRELVRRELGGRTLVFSRTRRGVDYVAEQLGGQGIRVGALHGDMDQGRRDRVVQQFRAGELDILVATNVAARGIDIPEITHVVNFDVPQNAEEYVHRIGRTGRAGREGKAITFVCERDLAEFDVLLQAFGDRLHKEELELYG